MRLLFIPHYHFLMAVNNLPTVDTASHVPVWTSE